MRGRARLADGGSLVACLLAAALLMPAPGARAEPYRTVAAPLRLVPTGPVPTSLTGLNDYFGVLEIDAAGDGLVVINRLSLEKYLLGLNEVPPDWPAEALRAQAIAARTYALWTTSRPPAGSAATYGFDICASTECQVFTGAGVLAAPDGARWMDAVEATSGRALLYEGEPILARYHSVSGGHTLDNSQAFPEEPDFPYLRGVPSPTEEASPLDRWRVSFPLDDLRGILQQGGWWDDSELTEVRSLPSDRRLPYPDILFRGPSRRLVRTAQEFRELVGPIAARAHPNRYPSVAATSTGRLPETFPSNRMTVSTEGGFVEVRGRGWGHGVGMSQWGAHGLALRGDDAEEILAHYYRGAELGEVASGRPLDVGIDWGRRHVEATGAFRLVDASGRPLVDNAVGTWGFSWDGPGVVSVTAPAGLDRPLAVTVVRAPDRVRSGGIARIQVALTRPAQIHAAGGGRSSEPAIGAAGKDRVAWPAPAKPGRYRVEVRADAGGGRRAREVVTIEVVGSTSQPPSRGGGGSGIVALIGAALGVALIAIGASAFASTMRR
jgi:stage II sporulation protein D